MRELESIIFMVLAVKQFDFDLNLYMSNPSLREEPRSSRAAVIPSRHETSLLDWLESSGRLIARDNQEPDYLDEADEEISDLMAVDDSTYDLDDDDDIDLEE
jgi:hypothetical protein